MGRQCGHFLTPDDEELLIVHVRKKFPIVVFDSVYPPSWDRSTTKRTDDAKRWIVGDERAMDVLLESASQLVARDGERIGWQVRSCAFSCFEWNRRGLADQGRFYLNTTGAPIWKDVSALVGDDVEKSFDRACGWLKSHCVNVSQSGPGFWVSHDLVQKYDEERQKREKMRAARPKDPRDGRFYELSKKSSKRRTKEETAELIRYCEAMIEYVRDPRDDTAVKQWEKLLAEFASAAVARGADLPHARGAVREHASGGGGRAKRRPGGG